MVSNPSSQVLDCLSLAGASWSLWCSTQMEVECSKQSAITPEREKGGWDGGREGGREGGKEEEGRLRQGWGGNRGRE